MWRVRGFSAIDQARSQLATDALARGYAETMWIDSDIGFEPDDVDRLRCLELPLVCGVYPKRNQRELAAHVLPGTTELVFGQAGGLVELLYAGAGFLHVRREVYEAIQRELRLPVCNERFNKPLVPFFQPLVVGGRGRGPEVRGPGEGDRNQATGDRGLPENEAIRVTRVFPPPNQQSAIRNPQSPSPNPQSAISNPQSPSRWYLAEDFSFCERARRCGYRIWADTRVRLMHYGSYGFSWEDAGGEKQRHANYLYRVKSKDEPVRPAAQPAE